MQGKPGAHGQRSGGGGALIPAHLTGDLGFTPLGGSGPVRYPSTSRTTPERETVTIPGGWALRMWCGRAATDAACHQTRPKAIYRQRDICGVLPGTNRPGASSPWGGGLAKVTTGLSPWPTTVLLMGGVEGVDTAHDKLRGPRLDAVFDRKMAKTSIGCCRTVVSRGRLPPTNTPANGQFRDQHSMLYRVTVGVRG